VCVQKDAIVILNPDGTETDLGVEVRTTYLAPDNHYDAFGLKREEEASAE
jgi:hypothetical protein